MTIRQIAEDPRKSLIELEKALGVAPGTVLREMADLAEQSGDWSRHLPFESAVAFNEDPAVQAQYQPHVDECGYCQRLLDTLHPSPIDAEVFARKAAASQPKKPRWMVPAYWIPSSALAAGAAGVCLTLAAASNVELNPLTVHISPTSSSTLAHELRAEPSFLVRLEKSNNPVARYAAARVYFAADKPDLAWQQIAQGLELAGGVDADGAQKITRAALVSSDRPAESLAGAAQRLQFLQAQLDGSPHHEKDPTVYLERAEVLAKLGFNREALKSIQQYLEATKAGSKTLSDFSDTALARVPNWADHKVLATITSSETSGSEPN